MDACDILRYGIAHLHTADLQQRKQQFATFQENEGPVKGAHEPWGEEIRVLSNWDLFGNVWSYFGSSC